MFFLPCRGLRKGLAKKAFSERSCLTNLPTNDAGKLLMFRRKRFGGTSTRETSTWEHQNPGGVTTTREHQNSDGTWALGWRAQVLRGVRGIPRQSNIRERHQVRWHLVLYKLYISYLQVTQSGFVQNLYKPANHCLYKLYITYTSCTSHCSGLYNSPTSNNKK